MTIEWFGEGCLKITETGNRFSVLTEVPSPESGLNAPRHKTNVYLKIFSNLTDSLFFDDKNKNSDVFVISNAGDYELQENFIRGYTASVVDGITKTIYTLKIEEIKVAYLGSLHNKEWTPELGNFLGEVDIMLIPVGGGDVLDAGGAAEVIKQVEPKIVIPIFYKIPGLKIKRAELAPFLSKIEAKKPEEMDKLLIKAKDLAGFPEEETQVYILKKI